MNRYCTNLWAGTLLGTLVLVGLSGCWTAIVYEPASTEPENCLAQAVGDSAAVEKKGDTLRILTPDDRVAFVTVTDERKFKVLSRDESTQDLTFRTEVLSWLALANESCALKWERKTVKAVDPISLPKSEVGQPSHFGQSNEVNSCDTLKRCLRTLAKTTCRDNPDCGFDIKANPFEESICKTILDAMRRRSNDTSEPLPRECF